ncbi:hypothetical protein QBC35DRAFT_381208 [Podospora australis]|uniref:Probable endonuclease LCL3 n=1 Tax=Podospora australis TaxID=1536484 RepID=A0AAN7AK56_9PEZI|nr:hypothetical protein QBC35DRAFT_381208 [Podospora australis]
MCHHRRIIYGACNHFRWDPIAFQKCGVQREFEAGRKDKGCGEMWSHGFTTTKLNDRLCSSCRVKIERSKLLANQTRALIANVQEELKRIREILEPVPEQDDNTENGHFSYAASQASESRSVGSEKHSTSQRSSSRSSPSTPARTAVRTSLDTVDTSFLSQLEGDAAELRGIRSELGERQSKGRGRVYCRYLCSYLPGKQRHEPIMPWSSSSFSSSNSAGGRDDDRKSLINNNIFDTWVPPIAAAGISVGVYVFYQRYMRRIPTSTHVPASAFFRRSIFGKVTSVGDGDGLRLFHTPGGRLAGWGWCRFAPTDKKALKGQTISIRLAGVDAPEGAHFGHTAQPFANEALRHLTSQVLNRRVRAYVYRRDQYDRIVSTVYVRKPPFFLRKDVGLDLINQGLATAYEGKVNAEFGGPEMEAKYKAAEAVAKDRGKGMWSVQKPGGFFHPRKKVQELESPAAYKRRNKLLGEQRPTPPSKTKA